MFEITVVRYHSNPDSEYIGRGSILGNPFPITPTQSRDVVCDRYEKDFYRRLMTDDGKYGSHYECSDFINELRRLFKKGKEQGYLKLGCFCSPQRCHGDTIANYLRQNQGLSEIIDDPY